MTPTSNNSKRNLILILGIVFACLLLLVIRLGWIQIVKGDTYSERAVEQQTRDTPIEAERGTIYDRNGNEQMCIRDSTSPEYPGSGGSVYRCSTGHRKMGQLL